MNNRNIYSIDVLLNQTKYTPIVKLKQKSIILLKINRIIHHLLPISVRPYFRVANIRCNMLILETINASWKMRLLYEKTYLLSKLRKNVLPPIFIIKIIINPDLFQELKIKNNINKPCKYNQQKFRPLSATSAAYIKNIAMLSNEKLHNTLTRLADLSIKL